MGLNISTTGGFPRAIWDVQASRQVGLTAAGLIQSRAFDQGRGLDDQFHDSYSPRYFRFRKRKGYQTHPPNLTRTGRMRRSLRVKWATVASVGVGLSGAAAVYGTFVNRRRPFLGSSPKDRQLLRKALQVIVRAAIERAQSRR